MASPSNGPYRSPSAWRTSHAHERLVLRVVHRRDGPERYRHRSPRRRDARSLRWRWNLSLQNRTRTSTVYVRRLRGHMPRDEHIGGYLVRLCRHGRLARRRRGVPLALLRKGKKPTAAFKGSALVERTEFADRLIAAQMDNDWEAVLHVAYELDPNQFEEEGE